MLDAGAEARVAGDWVGERDAGIEAADEDRLPAAAGEPGDRDAFGVRVWMGEQQVEPAGHVQVEEREAAGAAEIELVHGAVLVGGQLELPHAEPFDVEHDDAAFGEIDAAGLL